MDRWIHAGESRGLPRGSPALPWAAGAGVALLIGVALAARFIIGTHGGNPPPSDPDRLSQTSPTPLPCAVQRSDSPPASEAPRQSFLTGFAAQVQSLQTIHDSIALQDEMIRIRDGLSPDQIPSALEFLERMEPTAARRELSLLLLRRWAGDHPAAAANHAMGLPAGELRRDALDQVALAWVTSDPARAGEWAAAITSGAEQEHVVTTIAHELVRTAPVEAIRLMVGAPDLLVRDELLYRAVAEWATIDSHAAIAWVREIPDESLREKALGGALTAWASQDPLSAARLAMSELPSNRVQADTLASIAGHWAQHDPPKVTAGLGQLPSGELQDTIARSILAVWLGELTANPTP